MKDLKTNILLIHSFLTFIFSIYFILNDNVFLSIFIPCQLLIIIFTTVTLNNEKI